MLYASYYLVLLFRSALLVCSFHMLEILFILTGKGYVVEWQLCIYPIIHFSFLFFEDRKNKGVRNKKINLHVHFYEMIFCIDEPFMFCIRTHFSFTPSAILFYSMEQKFDSTEGTFLCGTSEKTCLRKSIYF